jgi:hypothetical protein
LLKALKEGRLRLAMGGGNGMGKGLPIKLPGGGKGGGIGDGYVGMSDAGSKINKSSSKASPKMMTFDTKGEFAVDPRANKEFVKNAMKPMQGSKYTPNSKVPGNRLASPNELQQNFKGDPDGQYLAGTPLYQAYQSGKRSLESPVNKEQIPAAYRKQVKEYFESINPGK